MRFEIFTIKSGKYTQKSTSQKIPVPRHITMNVFLAALSISVFMFMCTLVNSQPIDISHSTQATHPIVVPELEVIPGLEFLTSGNPNSYRMFNPIKAGLMPIF